MSNFRIDQAAQGIVAVTPSNTVNIAHPTGNQFTKGIMVGVSGDVSVLMADSSTGVIPALTAGVIHWLSVQRVNVTGTTATGITALY